MRNNPNVQIMINFILHYQTSQSLTSPPISSERSLAMGKVFNESSNFVSVTSSCSLGSNRFNSFVFKTISAKCPNLINHTLPVSCSFKQKWYPMKKEARLISQFKQSHKYFFQDKHHTLVICTAAISSHTT